MSPSEPGEPQSGRGAAGSRPGRGGLRSGAQEAGDEDRPAGNPATRTPLVKIEDAQSPLGIEKPCPGQRHDVEAQCFLAWGLESGTQTRGALSLARRGTLGELLDFGFLVYKMRIMIAFILQGNWEDQRTYRTSNAQGRVRHEMLHRYKYYDDCFDSWHRVWG